MQFFGLRKRCCLIGRRQSEVIYKTPTIRTGISWMAFIFLGISEPNVRSVAGTLLQQIGSDAPKIKCSILPASLVTNAAGSFQQASSLPWLMSRFCVKAITTNLTDQLPQVTVSAISPKVCSRFKAIVNSQMATTVTDSIKINQRESGQLLLKNNYRYCKLTSPSTVIPMARISSESLTWLALAKGWRKSGSKTAEHARKNIKIRETETDRHYKLFYRLSRLTSAWRRQSLRPRETRLSTKINYKIIRLRRLTSDGNLYVKSMYCVIHYLEDISNISMSHAWKSKLQVVLLHL